jgi:hypothetical protein
MNIIFGKEIADELRKRHTVLELETFADPEGKPYTAYCVLPQEALPITEMHDLDRLCRLHEGLVTALNEKRYPMVLECISHLRGSFSGEMDSFYKVISDRISKINQHDAT